MFNFPSEDDGINLLLLVQASLTECGKGSIYLLLLVVRIVIGNSTAVLAVLSVVVAVV